ncbi:biopolymer transporter ExbD [Prevotella sp. S7-1-8]|uniref:ExbD/TolR family protein n=1 Tax=Prevotella sp. S7-1-8 TaxID=1284775 RepID=UPI00050F48BE|nr:biopolymer transporter ExbD [Prevotella sp. S7-1-8]KGF17958.1 biopolymer transporter ExbD [Prevotella sp. S7-1-8]
MSMFRHRDRQVPGLNTASLPDLIFTVLFFFMIVTHMQKVAVKVQYRLPQGTELTRLTKKTAVTYIYIGRPAVGTKLAKDGKTYIQINDRFVNADDVADYVSADQARMLPEDREIMTVAIKADRDTRMGIITDVKQALRKAKATHVTYSADKRKE